jgi:beta-aspartyl-peptidase (threonine type)
VRNPHSTPAHGPVMKRYVLAHGGSDSKRSFRDGTDAAADAGWKALVRGDALEAVTSAVAVLEDDERFNAGTGSTLRIDGRTIEMDAAVVDSRGRYGGVACIERVKNPVHVAHSLVGLPTNLLCGPAATAFARRLGHLDHDPATAKARRDWRKLVRSIASGHADRGESEWDQAALERHWNYEVPFQEVFGDPRRSPGRSRSTDTVGAVACDGRNFAAAASTGGGVTCLRGRIGDSAILGAGLFASERGAVACSGLGDHILRQRVASRVDGWLEAGASPSEAVRLAAGLFPLWVDIVLIVAGKDGYAAGGNVPFAVSGVQEGKMVEPEVEVHKPDESRGEVREPGLGEVVPVRRRRQKR